MTMVKICAKNSINLISIEWVDLFKLWNVPISILCENIVCSVEGLNAAEGLEQKIKHLFSDFFLKELGRCMKIKTKMTVEQSVTPVFKPKRTTIHGNRPGKQRT